MIINDTFRGQLYLNKKLNHNNYIYFITISIIIITKFYIYGYKIKYSRFRSELYIFLI